MCIYVCMYGCVLKHGLVYSAEAAHRSCTLLNIPKWGEHQVMWPIKFSLSLSEYLYIYMNSKCMCITHIVYILDDVM